MALLAALAAGACRNSSSGGAAVFASSRIGPAGGVLVVESGKQAGLILTVAPGVLTETVDFRVRDYIPPPLPPGVVSGMVEPPGFAFVLEPEDLVLDQNVRLRLPYQPTAIQGTGPGNVEVVQTSPFTTRGYDPVAVDVGEGFCEIDIKTFGRFQVVSMPPVDPLSYVPPSGVVAEFDGGLTFEVRDVAGGPPFVASTLKQWQLTGSFLDEGLLFDGYQIVGRVSESASWLEAWSEPFSPFQVSGQSGFVIPSASPMQVQAPIGSLSLGASVQPFGFMSYELPEEFDGELLRDILKVGINVDYARQDLGSASRDVVFWFSPSRGILRVSIDGMVFDRIP